MPTYLLLKPIFRASLMGLLCVLANGAITVAQDTFSIVAVDLVTGEVGSAGASCLDDTQFPGSNGAQIIAKLYPGRGAINTQAYYQAANQDNAGIQLKQGFSPEEVIQWLQTNDAFNDPSVRQYGIVDFAENGSARAAAFTGQNCDDYKSHIVGPNYAIQGNILLGQEILDSMEARFLTTEGTLAHKLMAALQGANVPGADTRCAVQQVSSLSAFLRVAQPDDSETNYTLDLIVPATPFAVEPIDELQTLFDQWTQTLAIMPQAPTFTVSLIPNPFSTTAALSITTPITPQVYTVTFTNIQGKQIFKTPYKNKAITLSKSQFPNTGLYFYQIHQAYHLLHIGRLVVQK